MEVSPHVGVIDCGMVYNRESDVVDLEVAALKDAAFKFYLKYGRLSNTEGDLSEFYICPFKRGECYIADLTNDLVVWTGEKWLTVANTIPQLSTGVRPNWKSPEPGML